MGPDESRADLQGPTGNSYEKYSTGNPVSRLLVRRFLQELDAMVTTVEPRSILDVGCGEGIVTERIARLVGPSVPVEGLDVEDATLRREWTRREGGALSFSTGSAYRLPHGDDSVDLVMAVEVFEHLKEPARALEEVARVARRAIIITTPREPLWRFGNMMSGRYWRRLGNTPGHVNHWSRRGLTGFLSAAGRVRDVRSPAPWTCVRVDVGS